MGASIVAVANRKGGVGKTTTVINLAYALAAAGERVLAVDLDSQASLTAMMLGPGARPEASARFAEALLAPEGSAAGLPVPVAERLELLPGGEALVEAEDRVAKRRDILWQFALANALDAVLDAYDVILLDLPGTLDNLADIALAAADRVIVPTSLRSAAVVSTASYLHKIVAMRGSGPGSTDAFNPNLVVHGVLPTMVAESYATAQIRSLLATSFAAINGHPIRILREVPYSEWAPQAELYGLAALTYRPKASVSLAYRAIADDLRAELGRGA